jgi:sulfane dehydrogenase subunit SoxC
VYEISGIAWSGCGAIRKVEVSTDGGKSWKEAEIQGPVHRMAHVRFGFAWNWNGEEALLQSRCTDEIGQAQPSVTQFAKFWSLTIDQIKKGASGFGHVNFIHTWGVSREGSVHNVAIHG